MVGKHAIARGKEAEAKLASKEMADFVAKHHPRVLHFQINVSADEREMTVLQIHPDEASLAEHIELAGEKIRAAYAFLEGTTQMLIFGDPSPKFRETIDAMSGGAPVEINGTETAFSRLGLRSRTSS
jgi:hypothetical protein